MLGHHPVQTSWSGWYEQAGSKDNMNFTSLIINNRKVQGSGEDTVGKFSLQGKINEAAITFDKTYEGAHTVVYSGRFIDNSEGGQIIEGEWHLQGFPEDSGGPFRLSRSLELERKRDAAFKMVVANMKMIVGLVRFLLEDVGFTAVQIFYLFESGKIMSSASRNFTLLSLAGGLFLSIAGPINEAFTSRRLRQAGGELASPGPPPSVDGGDLSGSKAGMVHAGGGGGLGGNYMTVDDDSSAHYDARLASAEAVLRGELLTGNLDYVDTLMERPERPAEVPDVAITDVIVSSRGVHRVLLGSVVMYWLFVLSVPFAFPPDCQNSVPAKAHLCFMCISFVNLFTQIWVAAFTKYGYLMLIHAPQQFGFSLFLSFLGSFDSYSDIIFVAMARQCKSELWKPAAAIYVVGVLCAQALPGIVMLAARRNIPAALKLTELNVLLLLLKPSMS